MDYYSMKRKELQALCKKHKIPANSANSVLADKLSQLLNEKQIPVTQQRNCLKSPVETADECEPGVLRRQAKKVRFSPTNEVVEYELRNGKKQMSMATETRARRKSVAKKADESVVGNVNNTAGLVDDGVQAPVKLTRSRVQLLEKDVVANNGKKQGRRAVKDVEKGTDSVKEPEGNLGRVTRLKVHTLGERGAIQVDKNKQSSRSYKDSEIAGESVEEPVAAQVRVTRSKTLDANPQVQMKRGRPRVAEDVKNVEPLKEIMDIPVRVMRSSRQTVKEDTGSTIAKSRVDKKRTRREMKATDLNNNLSNVAPEEKWEPLKRKSLRTKGIEVVDEVEDDKVEVINDSRLTRSKAPAMKPSGRNTRSKAENKVEVQRKSKRVQQSEEPLENASKKNVSRRKSVMQPGKIEEVLHFEEPVNRPATRRKSMMQKAPGNEIDKALFGNMKSVNKTSIAELPIDGTRKTVGRKKSEGQSNNLFMIKEGLDDTENVIGQGKDASESEMGSVAFATGSPKSKKRSGDPIIEDQVIETEYVSPVDASSKRSTRSDSRSQGKAVTYSPQSSVSKKQLESISKTRASSGAMIRDGSSKKRAKLSRTKINVPEDHAEKSNTMGSPVLKLVNIDLDEKVIETGRTHGIDESHRRLTRSACISDRKEPSQSAIKNQPVGDAQLSLPKVTKFTLDPAVNTAPGRVTRSGIKLGGNRASSFSEKLSRTKLNESDDHADKSNAVGTPVLKSNFDLDEKVTKREFTPGIVGSHRGSTRRAIISDRKKPSQSAVKKQLVGDAQLSLHKVTNFTHDPPVNTAPGRVTRSGIKHGRNAAISFSGKLSGTKPSESEGHAEKYNTERTPVIKTVNFDLDEEVMETACTPDIGGSHRQSTRTAVIRDGKEPSRSALKKQHIGDAQLSSHRVTSTKFRHDPAVKTAPSRVTRGAIKHGGNVSVSFSERVDKKKQLSQSAHKSKPLEDAQMFSPELAEVRPSSDLTVGVQSATSIEVTGQLEDAGDISAAGSVRLPTKVAEEDMAQMFSPEVAELMPNPDLTVGAQSGTSIEVTGQLEDAGDISAAGSVRLPTKIAEEDTAQMFSPEVAEVRPNSVLTVGAQSGTSLEVTGQLEDAGDISAAGSVRLPTIVAEEDMAQMFSPEVAEVMPDSDLNVGAQSGTSIEVTGQLEDAGDISAVGSVRLPTKVAEEDTAQMFSPEVAELIPNPDLTVGAQSGTSIEVTGQLEDAGDISAAGSVRLPTKVAEEDTAQMFSPEVAEVRPNPVLTVGAQSGTSVEVTGQLEDAGDISAAGSVRLPTIVAEEDVVPVSESAGVTESLSFIFSGSYATVKDVGEVMEVAGDCAGKFSVELPSSAAEVEVTDSRSMLKELQTDVSVDASVVSVGKTVVMNESVDVLVGVTAEKNNSGTDNECVSNPHKACSSPIRLVSFKQTDDMVKSKERETLGGSLTEDLDYEQVKKESKQDVTTCNDSFFNHADKYEAGNNSEHDDKDERANSQMQVMNESVYEDNQLFDMDKRDGVEYAVDAGKELAKEPEFEEALSTGNDIHEIPMLHKTDGVATKETDSMPLSGDNMPSDGEDVTLNGDDAEDEAFYANREHESSLKPLTDVDSDTPLFGKDDDFNITRLFEPTSEPTSSDDMIETHFSGNDTYGESHNAINKQKPHLKPLIGNDDVQDEVNILSMELETGLETSNANSGLEFPVIGDDVDVDRVMDDRSDGQDVESERECKPSNATSTMDEQNVGGAGLMPAPPENMPVMTKVVTRSSDLEREPMSNVSVGKVPCDTDGICAPVGHSASTVSTEALQTSAVTTLTVDACEESIPDINTDAQICGDIYGLENAQHVTDSENDRLSELKVIGISEPDEGAPPKGSGIASPGTSIKQITEETIMKSRNYHASTDKKEHTVSTIDLGIDSGKSVEDFPNHGVVQSELLGNIKTHNIPTTEEHSGQLMGEFGGHGSLFAKESMSITYGKEESPVGDTLLDSPTSVKDDDRNKQGLQTSARASSSIEGNYSHAADFVYSEKSTQQGYRNVVDRDFYQDADVLKENTNANITEELIKWPDSSLKALFTEPATTPSSHLKGQQVPVSVDVPDGSHNESIGRKGTPTLDSARVFNAFSLETLFTTPATTQITHVKDSQMENESSEVFNGETQVNETHGQEHVPIGGPNFENFYDKYFEDEEVDGSSDRLGEFKGDPYDLSSEAARTGHLEASNLKSNSIRGGMPEKNKNHL